MKAYMIETIIAVMFVLRILEMHLYNQHHLKLHGKRFTRELYATIFLAFTSCVLLGILISECLNARLTG